MEKAKKSIAVSHSTVTEKNNTKFLPIQQIVEIPENRRLTIEVPAEVPTGPVVLILKPATELSMSETTASIDEALDSARAILTKHLPAFEALAK